jgi:hypothetical protein
MYFDHISLLKVVIGFMVFSANFILNLNLSKVLNSVMEVIQLKPDDLIGSKTTVHEIRLTIGTIKSGLI